MPLIKPMAPKSGEDGGQRTTFRPPWVKDAPPAIPMPSAPWTLKRRESQPQQQPPVQSKVGTLQKQDTKPDSKPDLKPVNTIQKQETKPESKPDNTKPVNIIQKQDTKPEKVANNIPVQRQDTKSEKAVTNVQVQRQDTKPEKTVTTIHRPDTKPEKPTSIPVQRQETKLEKNIVRNATPKNEAAADKQTSNAPLQRKETQDKKAKPFQRMDAIDGKSVANSQVQKNEPQKGKEVEQPVRKEPKPQPAVKEATKPDKKDEPKKKVQISDEPKIVTDMPPPPPMAPPMAPPMPPPPPPMASAKPPIDTKPLSSNQKVKLDSLRSRPRRRPDWTDMMKEVEEGVKLKHVVCNDRSAPVIPKAKAKGQFVYESETDNAHNLLLREIQKGVRLKKVRCNDRSKPVLDGLRKFRRQMTIEEQIVKKSTSMADVVAMAAEPDELDDIDKVRDDLQSTKQMLAHELRNKETLERENKRLMARLLNLEAELEKEKASRNIDRERGEIVAAQLRTAEDDKLINKLKEEASESSKMMKEMEDMYKKTAEELDVTRAKLESAWLQNAALEQEFKNIQNHPDGPIILPRLPSSKKLANASFSTRPAIMSSSEDESEEEESEEESDSAEEVDAENTAALQEKRTARELRLMTTKLKSMKEKRHNAKKEKIALNHQFANLTKSLNTEKKRYRQLQKEVDKMAKLVKDVEEDEDMDEPEDEEEEETEESESEKESEESDESDDSEGDLPESASSPDKISNLTRRLKVYENRLTSLKKCNYLLKANIDRRQDEINKQKEVILSLQEDLNNVLAELG